MLRFLALSLLLLISSSVWSSDWSGGGWTSAPSPTNAGNTWDTNTTYTTGKRSRNDVVPSSSTPASRQSEAYTVRLHSKLSDGRNTLSVPELYVTITNLERTFTQNDQQIAMTALIAEILFWRAQSAWTLAPTSVRARATAINTEVQAALEEAGLRLEESLSRLSLTMSIVEEGNSAPPGADAITYMRGAIYSFAFELGRSRGSEEQRFKILSALVKALAKNTPRALHATVVNANDPQAVEDVSKILHLIPGMDRVISDRMKVSVLAGVMSMAAGLFLGDPHAVALLTPAALGSLATYLLAKPLEFNVRNSGAQTIYQNICARALIN